MPLRFRFSLTSQPITSPIKPRPEIQFSHTYHAPKVEKAIDGTVEELKKVQADEVVQKDVCVKDLRENDKAIMIKNREIKESHLS